MGDSKKLRALREEKESKASKNIHIKQPIITSKTPVKKVASKKTVGDVKRKGPGRPPLNKPKPEKKERILRKDTAGTFTMYIDKKVSAAYVAKHRGKASRNIEEFMKNDVESGK